MEKLYPDSGVELSEFTAKNYDKVMNVASFGKYKGFIQKAISDLNIQKNDKILDLGCGTGRNVLLMNKYVSEDSLLVGLDISEDMEKQFNDNCGQFSNIKFINRHFGDEEYYDVYEISKTDLEFIKRIIENRNY